jgi:hypothetical protein
MSVPADRAEGVAWAALGVAIVVLSALMDRLADQGVPPFAAPGLLPGLLGAFMVLSGFLLVLRRPVAAGVAVGAPAEGCSQTRRLSLVLALCLVFSLGLVGHGLPFWLAASLFVTVAILVLQSPQRPVGGHKRDLRAFAFRFAGAVAIGIGAGSLATLLFQEIFLVHLP